MPKPLNVSFYRRFCLLALALLPAWAAAQDDARIEDLMSADERAATGVEGLSDRELEALNRWLRDRGVLPPVGAGNRAAVAESVPPRPVYGQREPVADVITRIEGEFGGWDGKTVFTLANGQVYQQRRPGRWKTSLDNPEVRIRKSFIGYEMEIDGRSIGVKRIR